MIYLDSCALVKLVHSENDSSALVKWLDKYPGTRSFTSELARAELPRVLRRRNHDAQGTVFDAEAFRKELRHAAALLETLTTVTMDGGILDAAGALSSPSLKTLDAIHLVSADRLGSGVTQFITYDQGLSKLASEAGFPVISPR